VPKPMKATFLIFDMLSVLLQVILSPRN